ncbi:MAG: xanthine dehydrogenase family protein molybdopterin-binding subunit, partial [Planctomycetota bacterium]
LPVSEDEHGLCQERVRHIGDPIAAVAAVDEETAEYAARLIEVEYEKLPEIATIDDALKEDLPRIHEYGAYANVHKAVSMEFGDTAQGFAEADHVREDLVFYEGNTHLPMEQHASLAYFDADGRLTLHSSTQTPHYVHKALSKVLAPLPAYKIRVIACPNGGGFGGKSDPFQHELCVARLAMVTGRPVKIALTREEVFYCHRGRHPVMMKIKTGVTKEGDITAMHLQTALDGGAYGSYGVASTFYTGALQTVTYHVPRYRFDGARAFTNKPACGPKRGHGTVQPRFAQEIQLDKIAHDLSINPAELRKKILVKPHSVTANYLRVSTIALEECIDAVVKGSNFKERYGKLPRGYGLGLACSSYLTGAGLPIYWNKMPHSGATLLLDRCGQITVGCGSTEIGQGSDTVLAFCVAEVLGVTPDEVRVVVADTALTPIDLGSYSSRVTLMSGNAAIQAAMRARDLLAKAVSEKLAVPAGHLVFAERRVFASDDPELSMSLEEAIRLAEAKYGTIGTTGSYTPPRSPGRYKGAGVGPTPTYSYSATVVEAIVDEETGIIRIPRIFMAHDIGRSLIPASAMGQVEGGVYMGLGEALMEEMAYRGNRGVVHKIPSLLDYKSPTTLEMPEVITYLIEDPDPEGPFGAKEVGQGPLLPIMPAVANAVFDAVGARVDYCPITPERVRIALERGARGQEARFGPKRFPGVTYPEPMNVPPPWEGGDGKAQPRAKEQAAAAAEVR